VERRADVRLITTYYDLPCFFIHSFIPSNLFFFVDVRHCFGLQETQAASADALSNLHSKLGASPYFSRKITTRYLLKLIMPIIIYYHSTLRMTDSISPAGCSLITTLLALFYLFVNFRLNFDIVLVCRRPRHLPPMRVQIIIPNLTPVNSYLQESLAPAFR
jgi:hypothetical protein